MTIAEVQAEIIRMKEEQNVCILAHSYQNREILEVADFSGDSYYLSVEGAKVPQENIILCGVKFMAETSKLLSPEKNVYLAGAEATCPMADCMPYEMVEEAKKEYPEHTVVCYINTTAELKSISDVCVTSSSAVQICKNIQNDKILFIPDKNLASFVATQLPEKEIVALDGCCPYHNNITVEDVENARAKYPEALLLIHPECPKEVADLADVVGSTSKIMEEAQQSDKKEFIIGTEISIAEHLSFMCPDKKFYHLSSDLLCTEMQKTTLMDLYHCLKKTGGLEIVLSEEVMEKSALCIQKMIELSS